MNKSIILSTLIGSLFLVGCSGGGKKSGEDIQKKIDEAGWKVTDEGSKYYETISLEISPSEKIDISNDKEENKILYVSINTDSDEGLYIASREPRDKEDEEDKDDMGVLIYKDDTRSCDLYNITKDREDPDETNKSKTCKLKDVDVLKDSVKVRDEALQKYDLTLNDLFTWGAWYLNKK